MPDGRYTVNSLGHLVGTETLEITVSGTIPNSGEVELEKNNIKNACLKFGDYAVPITNGSVGEAQKASCNGTLVGASGEGDTQSDAIDISAIIEALPGVENEVDGYKYIENDYVQAHPVYYNPADPSEECTSTNSISTTGTKTGCMKWYTYSVKDGIVNMILDHNINPSGTGVTWVSSTDYSNSETLGASLGVTGMGNGSYGSYGNNDKGPLTALNYLKTNTSDWETSVQGDYSTYTANTSNASYSIDYSGYTSRLITAQEIAYIKGASWT